MSLKTQKVRAEPHNVKAKQSYKAKVQIQFCYATLIDACFNAS